MVLFGSGMGSFYDRYSIVDTISEGSTGCVRLAVAVGTSKRVAVKIILKDLTSRESIEKEIVIHRSLKHPHVVALLEVLEDDQSVYIVMEYASGGELFDKIVPDVGVDEDLAHFYFRQLMHAVKYLHDRGVCHRDLKPENIFLDQAGNLKLGDFGFSTVFSFNTKQRRLQTPCGTPPYVAPEVYNGNYHGPAIDVWSCGIILVVLLLGGTPWDEPTTRSREFVEYTMTGFSDSVLWEPLSQHVRDLLAGMLAIEESKRLTIDRIFNHPWFTRSHPLLFQHAPSDLTARFLANLRQSINSSNRMGLSQPDMADLNASTSWLGSLSQPVLEDNDMSCSQKPTQALPMLGLNRFYSRHPVAMIMDHLGSYLRQISVQVEVECNSGRIGFLAMDRRRCPLKGEVHVRDTSDGLQIVAFCRKKGDPIEFKRLFFGVVRSSDHMVVSDSLSR